MNITSVVVAASLMGIAAPGVANMAIQPMLAQKRANNFAVAEALAVSFAAANEGEPSIDMNSFNDEKCELNDIEDRAYSITCTEGQGQFVQTAERSFRLEVDNNTFDNPNRQFAWEAPLEHSQHQCHANDPWGVIWFNEHLAASGVKPCRPVDSWNEQKYLRSDPDDWLWDLSNYGFGQHPDY